MKKGDTIGRAIDVDWRRSVKIPTPDQAKLYFPDFDPQKEFVIANVKEFKDFFVARFQKDAIEKVVVNREQLFEKASIHHIGIRFILKSGKRFELVSQNLKKKREKRSYSSLSFGIFALGVPGNFFGFGNSVKGDLVSAQQSMHRFKELARTSFVKQ